MSDGGSSSMEIAGVPLTGKLTQLDPKERNDGNIMKFGVTLPLETLQHDGEKMLALGAMFGETVDITVRLAQLPLAETSDPSGPDEEADA